MTNHKRVIGTLLPLTALLSPQNLQKHTNAFEIGCNFVNWLEKTHQTAWQLLPLHETQLETGSKTKHVPSPYKSYGIGLDPKYLNTTSLRRVYNRPAKQSQTGLEIFIEKHTDWIHDYSLFCVLRDHFGTDNWILWDKKLVHRDKKTLEEWDKRLQDKKMKYIAIQWHLHEAYAAFHKYAASKGVSLIGDLPFYPSFRSPLVWAHQDVFQINDDGTLPFVSGIPDRRDTHFGRQVWGHPLYNWAEHKEQVVQYWKMRLRYLASIFDHIRFDHAKAFFSYGVMDIPNPSGDHYAEGPGEEIFTTLIEFGQKQGLKIFVEDSGDKTAKIRATIGEMGISGLRIFKFALNGQYLHTRYAGIANYPERCVAYTTTHDTETLLSYLQSLTSEQKHRLSEASGLPFTEDPKAYATNVRNALLSSNASTVIIPLQDWLLTTDRINIPGTEKEIGDTNWQFVLDKPIEDLPEKVF